MRVLLLATFITLIALPGFGGQAGEPAKHAPDANPPASPSIWIDVYQGEPLRYREVLKDLAKADVIYLGERHTIQRHHEIQTEILTDLAHSGVPLALGLEQMEIPQQPQLDRYNRGEIDFEQLAEATGWAKRWHNYRQYRPVLEAARKAKALVVALNAKAETIREIVRSGGVDHLSPEVRKELPAEMQLRDPAYERLLSLQMMVHIAAMPKTLHPMIEAQIARDETMAEALTVFLKSPPGRGRKMLVVCGAGHVAYGLGMPARVVRRMPGTKERIVLLSESGELQLSPEERAQAREIEITHEQLREIRQPVADYLYVKPFAAEPELDSGKAIGNRDKYAGPITSAGEAAADAPRPWSAEKAWQWRKSATVALRIQLHSGHRHQ